MVPALPATLADRFALIIDGLGRVVAARHASGLAGPMVILIWTRLRRAGARFATLLARFEAGTLPASARPRRRTACRSSALPADPGDDAQDRSGDAALNRDVHQPAGQDKGEEKHAEADPALPARFLRQQTKLLVQIPRASVVQASQRPGDGVGAFSKLAHLRLHVGAHRRRVRQRLFISVAGFGEETFGFVAEVRRFART